MSLTQLSGRVADFALVAFFGLLLWSMPQLPEHVVSHFGADGPDGWLPKNTFVAIFAGSVIGFEVLFRWGLPTLMRRTPSQFVNLPYKSYWMATPERQQTAYEKVLDVVGPSRLFFAVVMLAALHACVQASGVPVFVEARIEWFGFAVGVGTLLYSGAIFVWAFRAFRPPAEHRG